MINIIIFVIICAIAVADVKYPQGHILSIGACIIAKCFPRLMPFLITITLDMIIIIIIIINDMVIIITITTAILFPSPPSLRECLIVINVRCFCIYMRPSITYIVMMMLSASTVNTMRVMADHHPQRSHPNFELCVWLCLIIDCCREWQDVMRIDALT